MNIDSNKKSKLNVKNIIVMGEKRIGDIFMDFLDCYIVKNKDIILESYCIKDNRLTANVSKGKIKDLIKDFISILNEPCFFFLELPLLKNEEKKLRKKDTDPFHKNVYYIDGCSTKNLLQLMDESGELLLNGGISNFGFASHNTKNEICIGKYNVIYINSNEFNNYVDIFNKYNYNIEKKDSIITAWDTFSADNPGESRVITINGKNVFDLVDDYKKWGLYLAEIRED